MGSTPCSACPWRWKRAWPMCRARRSTRVTHPGRPTPCGCHSSPCHPRRSTRPWPAWPAVWCEGRAGWYACTMSSKPLFESELAELAQVHLLRHRRQVAPLLPPADLSPDQEHVRGTTYVINGQTRLSFGGNDYLGLSQHPALILAAQQAAARYGVGATA